MSFTTSPYEGATTIVTNGVHPPSQPVVPPVAADQGSAPRRLPRRQSWIRLADEGEYADFAVLAKLRYPDKINTDFASGDFERIKTALRMVVLEHNHWLDPETGDELPPANQTCARDDFDEGYGAKLRDIEKRRRKLDVARQKEDANRPALAVESDQLTDEREEADRLHAEQVAPFEAGERVCCFWHKLAQEECLMMLKAIGSERGKVLSSIMGGPKS